MLAKSLAKSLNTNRKSVFDLLTLISNLKVEISFEPKKILWNFRAIRAPEDYQA